MNRRLRKCIRNYRDILKERKRGGLVIGRLILEKKPKLKLKITSRLCFICITKQ
jgi:hypothetical protein